MLREIGQFDANRLQSATTEDLTKHFYERYLLHAARVLRDEGELDSPAEEVQIDAAHFPHMFRARPGMKVPGVRYVLRVPFEGSPELFRYQPSTSTMSGTPAASIDGQQVVLTSERLSTEAPEVVEAGFRSVMDEINQHLGWVKSDLEQWLPQLRRTAQETVDARKQKLGDVQNAVARMGFKLKERPDAAKTFPTPEVRRKVQPVAAAPLPGSPAPFKPEPTLEETEYDHILSVIARSSLVFERSPHAFAIMDEETLRTHLLVQLNGHYDGQATGETFNFEGKTDILVRAQGKNIFIGECKIWGGKKELWAAIDQLLGYLQWRDTKAAIIIFNRNKDFSAVLAQIRPLVESHPKFKRFEKQVSETSFRFAFKQRDDEAREMTLTVLLFNVPLPAPDPATPAP